ncbi:alpha/beta fold hydrolase [Phenylobacterium sp.]|uniref:alpha/beta fold hydrolase n=1 Tax=Phenylobacterium sp. TaxID=1871053 RepID=UPI0037C8C3B7
MKGRPMETAGELERADGERLAWRRVAGSGPTLVWLGGFRSEMSGTKAQALADWALARGRGFLRFDYLGHGESTGDFAAGTIGRWREDALAAVDALTEGPLVLVGSSMGGWLAMLAALARPERVQALVLIAPAADFTEALMKPEIPPEGVAALDREGVWLRPSLYGDPYPITARLLQEGKDWSVLDGRPIPISAPIRILQGGEDPDVPWRHALRLVEALDGPDVVFTLIRDGDHRLSRDQDIARLIAEVEGLTAPTA